MFMLGVHSDAPDSVLRTGFNENLSACSQEKLTQFTVLPEFGNRSSGHYLESIADPDSLIESTDLSTQAFCLSWAFSLQDLGQHTFITEEPSLLGHHVVL